MGKILEILLTVPFLVVGMCVLKMRCVPFGLFGVAQVGYIISIGSLFHSGWFKCMFVNQIGKRGFLQPWLQSELDFNFGKIKGISEG